MAIPVSEGDGVARVDAGEGDELVQTALQAKTVPSQRGHTSRGEICNQIKSISGQVTMISR